MHVSSAIVKARLCLSLLQLIANTKDKSRTIKTMRKLFSNMSKECFKLLTISTQLAFEYFWKHFSDIIVLICSLHFIYFLAHFPLWVVFIVTFQRVSSVQKVNKAFWAKNLFGLPSLSWHPLCWAGRCSPCWATALPPARAWAHHWAHWAWALPSLPSGRTNQLWCQILCSFSS